MHYIVGLGNPGAEYKNTRHNVGWLFLDKLRHDIGAGELEFDNYANAQVGQGRVADEPVTFIYPETFMNLSGQAVKQVVPIEALERLLVVYDDVDLPVGAWRLAFDRGAGGHNGVTSIINSVGTTQFARLRIGIGLLPVGEMAEEASPVRPAGADLPRFVLGCFSPTEAAALKPLLAAFPDLVTTWVPSGHQAAMTKFN